MKPLYFINKLVVFCMVLFCVSSGFCNTDDVIHDACNIIDDFYNKYHDKTQKDIITNGIETYQQDKAKACNAYCDLTFVKYRKHSAKKAQKKYNTMMVKFAIKGYDKLL